MKITAKQLNQANKEYQKLIKLDKNKDRHINIHDFKEISKNNLYNYTKIFAKAYYTKHRSLDIKYINYQICDVNNNKKIERNELQLLKDIISTEKKALASKDPVSKIQELEKKAKTIKKQKIRSKYFYNIRSLYAAIGIREYFIDKNKKNKGPKTQKEQIDNLNKKIQLNYQDFKKAKKQGNAYVLKIIFKEALSLTDQLLNVYLSSRKITLKDQKTIYGLIHKKNRLFKKLLFLNPASPKILKAYAMFNSRFSKITHMSAEKMEKFIKLAEKFRNKEDLYSAQTYWLKNQLTQKKYSYILALIKNNKFNSYRQSVLTLKKAIIYDKIKKEEVPLVLHILFNKKFIYTTNKHILKNLISPKRFFDSAQKSKGKGVCDEWAYAFSSILNELNIPNYFCLGQRSRRYGHAFSLFKIGSRWYSFQESGIGKYSYKDKQSAFNYSKKDLGLDRLYCYKKNNSAIKKAKKYLRFKDSENNTLYFVEIQKK